MKTTSRALRLASVATLVAAVPLGGCEVLNARPPVDIAPHTYAAPEPVMVPVVNNGAIFQAVQYRPLFEDHRARLVGDSLTVQIVEKVSASQKSTSTIDKSGKLNGSISALPGFSLNSFNRAAAAGTSVSYTHLTLPTILLV